jgi:hypothetical protein
MLFRADELTLNVPALQRGQRRARQVNYNGSAAGDVEVRLPAEPAPSSALITVGANTPAGSAGNDTFVFFAGAANGATVAGFDGLDAAQGDTLIFSGFGSAAQGATFTSLGGNTWQIHSGLDAHDETITLSNGASIHATDFLFV